MKNYKIKALIVFEDLEENKRREIGDEFLCTKERYEFLKNHNAVELVGKITEKVEDVYMEPIVIEEVKAVETKKNTKRKKENE